MSAGGTSGSSAVMAAKRPKLSAGTPWERLELFPTPPFATRTLIEHVMPALHVDVRGVVWDPAAGLGHMTDVFNQYCDIRPIGSDVFQYEMADGRTTEALGIHEFDFCSGNPVPWPWKSDFIVTNPPFGRAHEFLARALKEAQRGVALLLRMQWLESDGRFTQVFAKNPPTHVAQFSERVAMCEGGYDPKLSTATAYAWFIWLRDRAERWMKPAGWSPDAPLLRLDFSLIPPGQKCARFHDDDLKLAARHVPGWVAPSTLKKIGRAAGLFAEGAPA